MLYIKDFDDVIVHLLRVGPQTVQLGEKRCHVVKLDLLVQRWIDRPELSIGRVCWTATELDFRLASVGACYGRYVDVDRDGGLQVLMKVLHCGLMTAALLGSGVHEDSCPAFGLLTSLHRVEIRLHAGDESRV